MLRLVMSVLILLPALSPLAPLDTPCSRYEERNGICPTVAHGGGSVDFGASSSEGGPSSGGSPSGSDRDSDGAGRRGDAPGGSVPAENGEGLGGNPREIIDVIDSCAGVDAGADACQPDGAPTVRPVTLTDLESFSPAAASIRMEPDGWMLVGLPANFLAGTGTEGIEDDGLAEVASGTLLGRPISVRFTPVSYTWSWGDGSSDTVATTGRTWEDLGLRRFSETATSHVYRERGAVAVTLDVAYAVEYSFDGSAWTGVTGTVSTAAAIDAYVGTAKTVLVDGNCTDHPDDPGC